MTGYSEGFRAASNRFYRNWSGAAKLNTEIVAYHSQPKLWFLVMTNEQMQGKRQHRIINMGIMALDMYKKD